MYDFYASSAELWILCEKSSVAPPISASSHSPGHSAAPCSPVKQFHLSTVYSSEAAARKGQTVMGVVEWVDRRGLSAWFILHVNKSQGKGTEALSRVMGSVAWVTTSRIA